MDVRIHDLKSTLGKAWQIAHELSEDGKLPKEIKMGIIGVEMALIDAVKEGEIDMLHQGVARRTHISGGKSNASPPSGGADVE